MNRPQNHFTLLFMSLIHNSFPSAELSLNLASSWGSLAATLTNYSTSGKGRLADAPGSPVVFQTS